MASSSFVLYLLILLVYLNLQALECASSLGNETDRVALLAIKDQITSDPLGALSSWNVKVLNLENRRASKSFVVECRALRNVRHRNLVKVLSACSSLDFKSNDFNALIFEYMPNGNLDKWLHSKKEGQNHLQSLSFTQRRLRLDKLLYETGYNLSHNQSDSFAIKGSIGYVPPEYGLGGQTSTKGDVYKIVDPRLFLGEGEADFNNDNDKRTKILECLNSIVRLRVTCSLESPEERMEVIDIVKTLQVVKDMFVGLNAF
ncbi:hypothetical protein AAC387_Pa02g1502 [Persea americana]